MNGRSIHKLFILGGMGVLLCLAAGQAVADLGTYAIRQEFVWDDNEGIFQTVDLYTKGKITDYIADRCEVAAQAPTGSGSALGSAADYLTYSSTAGAWVNRYYCGTHAGEVIQRWGGQDVSDEATTTRYDAVTYGTDATGNYNVATAFAPFFEIELQNGWSIFISQDYSQWGYSATVTAPDGRYSTVYGDPHLVQAEGAIQQELAAVGEYYFDLGNGFGLLFMSMKSNDGFALVTETSVSGPNGYSLTLGRNGEFRRSGGTLEPDGEPDRIYYIEAPVNAVLLAENTFTVSVEANGDLNSANLVLEGTPLPMAGNGRSWTIQVTDLADGTYNYHVTGQTWEGNLQTEARSLTILVPVTTTTTSTTTTTTTAATTSTSTASQSGKKSVKSSSGPCFISNIAISGKD